MNKSRRQRRRDRKGKRAPGKNRPKPSYKLKNALLEGLASLGFIGLGLFLMSDFVTRMLQGQKIYCRMNEPPCIGEEFFYGIAFLLGGIFLMIHIYHMLMSNKKA